MDMLKWGAEWLSEISELNAVESVVVINGSSKITTAILCDEAGRLLPGKVAARTEHTNFLFETAKVVEQGISFVRGTYILWNDSYYEVVAEAGRFYSYNDTFKQKMLVKTKHVSDPYSS